MSTNISGPYVADCVACGRQISINAEVCPGCGEPQAGEKAKEKAIEKARKDREMSERIEKKKKRGNRIRSKNRRFVNGSLAAAALVGILFHAAVGSILSFILSVVLIAGVLYLALLVLPGTLTPTGKTHYPRRDLYTVFGRQEVTMFALLASVVLWPSIIIYMIVHLMLSFT